MKKVLMTVQNKSKDGLLLLLQKSNFLLPNVLELLTENAPHAEEFSNVRIFVSRRVAKELHGLLEPIFAILENLLQVIQLLLPFFNEFIHD